MVITINTKNVSCGIVELKDHGAGSLRYAIYINGQIRELSDNRDFMIQTFDRK